MGQVKVLDGYVLKIGVEAESELETAIRRQYHFAACVELGSDSVYKVVSCQGFANRSEMLTWLVCVCQPDNIQMAIVGSVHPSPSGLTGISISSFAGREITLEEAAEIVSLEDEIVDSYMEFIDHIVLPHRLHTEG